MKKLITYLKTLWSRVADSQRNDRRHDCRRSDLRRSPSGFNSKLMLKLVSVLVLILTIGVGNALGDTWTKVTAAPDSWAGEYLLVYESSSTAGVAWTGVDAQNCNTAVTISSGVISTKPDAAVSITVATMSGGYSIVVNGGTNNGKYLGRSGNSNGMDFGTTAVVNTFAYESSSVKITSAGGAIMRYNNTSSNYRFRYFKSSTYTSQQPVQLYKKSASCSNKVTLTTGTSTNATVTLGASEVETCSATAADRQVTISVAPSTCYAMPSDTRLTFTKSSGTATATYVSGPTWNSSTSKYDFVYRFAQNDNGAGNFKVSLSTKTTYTISYNKGTNGTGTNTTDTKTCGTALALKGAIFTRTGYTQTGWATSDGGAKVYNLSASYTTDAATTLYPFWTAETYTVTWMVNGTAYTTGTPSSSVTHGGKVATLPTAPSPASYCGDKFMGWTKTQNYDNSSAPSDLFTTASGAPTETSGNVTYYAVFGYYEE